MNKFHDFEYLRLVKDVLDNGVRKGDRTGTGTLSTFAQQMRFDLSDHSIPLLTTKKMHTKSIIHELIWFLSGSTNIKYLQENGVRIWNEWVDENGDLGPVYGEQWRSWDRVVGAHINYKTDPPIAVADIETIDQIGQVIHQLRNNPDDRRIIVSAWNVSKLEDMALPPCHAFFQFWSADMSVKDRAKYWPANVNTVELIDTMHDEVLAHEVMDKWNIPRRELRCHLYQRSCDVGLGVPFNIVQYSILTHMIAQVTGHVAREFIWTGGDTHIYTNHIEQLTEQLGREPLPSPRLILNPLVKEIDDFVFDDFEIVGYESHDTIKMQVSV